MHRNMQHARGGTITLPKKQSPLSHRETADSNETVEERVYQRIRTAIAKRYIGPGRKLVEETLARQLGVSRTPVRAAIRRLVHEGLVQVVPHRGAFVVKPTREEIQDAFAVRMRLEGMAACLAASNARPEDIAYLSGLIEEEAKLFGNRDINAYFRVNDAIHLKIAQLSGNKTLHEFVSAILSRVNIYLILYDPFMHLELNPSMEEHRAIVQMLDRHDGPGAEAAMSAHLESTLAGLELDKAQEYPDDYLVV